MNNKNNKRKTNSQLSLSQSLLRRKTKILASTNNTTTNGTEENTTNLQGCEDISPLCKTKIYSQPENDDFDDSFDLFLPRRSPKKPPSSQSSFFDAKKSTKSRYFDESGQLQVPKVIKDDDLDLAIAVSLQESKGGAVILKPQKAATRPIPRGKLKKACSQSLLMRRSAADRERIITEKVAIVLMNTNKISTPPPSESREPRLLYSAFLNERFNTLNTLWNLSQGDFTKIRISRFYTNVLLSYVDSPFQDRATSHSDASDVEKDVKEEISDLQLAISDEDIFGSSGDESCKSPSPKRPKSDELILPPSDESISTSQIPESENRRGGQGIVTSANGQSAVSGANMSREGMKRVSDASSEGISLRVEPSDFVTTEANVDDCSTSNNESIYDAKTPFKEHATLPATTSRNNSTRRSLGGSFMENTENFTFNKHLRKLSADLLSLSRSGISSIIEIRKESKTLYAHGCVVKARCPTLYDELMKNSGCLNEFSLGVCQAVLGYIYAADVGPALTLKLAEKNQLVECCLRFGLEELAEELFSKTEGKEETKNSLSCAETEVFLTEFPNEKTTFSADVPGHSPVEASPLSSGRASNREELPVSPESTPNTEAEKEVLVSQDRTPKPHNVNDHVIVLDSDCCSGEEVPNSEAPEGDVSDDELDLYLKDGIRLLEKSTCTATSPPEQEVNDDQITKETKRSIERYFQDSFPSLDGISVTPAPHQSCQVTKGPTPCSSRGIMNCVTPGGQLVVSEQATPMPNYESMVSPDLKEALQKYGIKKGIGRRKAVTLLRYIYDQIHPPSDHPAVAKAIGDVKSKSQADSLANDSDCDVYTLSSETSEDEEMFEDLGDVLHSQAEPESQHSHTEQGLLREVGSYIKSNTLLYAAVLKYEPIWLNKFHQTLKENGVKCNKKELIEVLDELGITFRTATTSRRTKKPPRRKE